MQTDDLPSPIRRLLSARRLSRTKAMLRRVTTWPGMSIIDIGCGKDGRSFSDYADESWNIVGIDLHNSVSHRHKGFKYYKGNAADLSNFRDGEFDLAVSIGMLEHVTDPITYEKVCSEIRRVAKQYVVIVPYRYAWIEPHYRFPFFGALPKAIQRALIRLFNLSGHRHHLGYFEDNFIWRSNREYLQAFQGSRIYFMPTLETIAIVKNK